MTLSFILSSTAHGWNFVKILKKQTNIDSYTCTHKRNKQKFKRVELKEHKFTFL